jgi:hypothetical protein
MSSTKKASPSPRPASNWPGFAAAAAADAADAADALGAAAAVAAVAAVAAGQLDVAAPAKAERVPTTSKDMKCYGRVMLDPAHSALVTACFGKADAAAAADNVDKHRRAS